MIGAVFELVRKDRFFLFSRTSVGHSRGNILLLSQKSGSSDIGSKRDRVRMAANVAGEFIPTLDN
jgi:hypothetical protein